MTTDERLDRLIFLMECVCKHFKVRVPKAPGETVAPKDMVSVVQHGRRGARLVPEEQQGETEYPTSTIRSREDFWRQGA